MEEDRNSTGYMDFSDFIYTQNNELDDDFCDELIDKYEEDEDKFKSIIIEKELKDNKVLGVRVHEPRIRNSTSLYIPGNDSWKPYDDVFKKSIRKNLGNYASMLADTSKGIGLNPHYLYEDVGYEIIKYEKGGFYQWHNDYDVNHYHGINSLCFIWHLNTLKSGSGGEIEFLDSTKISSQKGKLIIFPVNWNISSRHKKVLSSRSKYIVLTFLYAKPPLPPPNLETGT
tara:strand:+ start:94 stop:777 length:684 start_codon:yes stop_codon:yes gene_type:complete